MRSNQSARTPALRTNAIKTVKIAKEDINLLDKTVTYSPP